jgi:hypothetical protein
MLPNPTFFIPNAKPGKDEELDAHFAKLVGEPSLLPTRESIESGLSMILRIGQRR